MLLAQDFEGLERRARFSELCGQSIARLNMVRIRNPTDNHRI